MPVVIFFACLDLERKSSFRLPSAKIVFDYFHVIKLFNDNLSELQRKLFHEVNDIIQKQVLKGT